MDNFTPLDPEVYQRICLVAQQIPAGQVATYGQIAAIAGGCTARMVGFAMAGLPPGSHVPWPRVINAQGKISPRGNAGSVVRQREILEAEGVRFSEEGKIDLKRFQWSGPDWGWLVENGLKPEDAADIGGS
ncbi:MAG: MGMT family protein [Caldilineaceae bacterium]